MGKTSTDYDRIAAEMGEILAILTGNTHAPPLFPPTNSDSLTVTKTAWMVAVIRLQRLRDYAEGLAEVHRAYEPED